MEYVEELVECKMSGISILDLITFFERRAGKIRLDMLNPSWLYLSEGFRSGLIRRIGKRLLDLLVVLLLTPIALFLGLIVSIAILIESGGRGNVLYSQVRVKRMENPSKYINFAVWCWMLKKMVSQIGHQKMIRELFA